MNASELDEIVVRANLTLVNDVIGFIGCAVSTYDPPIVEYSFSDYTSANSFCLRQQTIDRKVWMGKSDLTVLEYFKIKIDIN